jgi:hypothetical protein
VVAALRSILAAERAFAGIVAAGIHKTNQCCDFRRISAPSAAIAKEIESRLISTSAFSQARLV